MVLSIRKDEELSANEVLERIRSSELQAQQFATEHEQSLKHCSRSMNDGYISQAVYACKTCLPSGTAAGFCIGCSMTCHLEHDVIELFNKRNFRCDCGTKRFEGCGQSSCSLYTADATESVENSENVYNHNFFGRYCICDKEYQEDSDTMFQCLRCQDWFHDKCVALTSPEDGDDRSFLCASCVAAWPFIHRYLDRPAAGLSNTADESSDSTSLACRRPVLPVEDAASLVFKNAIFLPAEIQEQLCRCRSCSDAMHSEGSILLVETASSAVDSVKEGFLVRDQAEIEPAELKPEFDSSAMLLKTLGGMERGKAIDGIRKFKGFVDVLKNGLARMQDQEPQHVITKDDIHAILNSRESASILGKRSR